jgi:hypothetical protein
MKRNPILALVVVVFVAVFSIAATIPYIQFNSNQFSVNGSIMSISDGAFVTNAFIFGSVQGPGSIAIQGNVWAGQLRGGQGVNNSPGSTVLIDAADTTDYAITGVTGTMTVTLSNMRDATTVYVDILNDATHTNIWASSGTTGTLKWQGGLSNNVPTPSTHNLYIFHQINGAVDASVKRDLR